MADLLAKWRGSRIALVVGLCLEVVALAADRRLGRGAAACRCGCSSARSGSTGSGLGGVDAARRHAGRAGAAAVRARHHGRLLRGVHRGGDRRRARRRRARRPPGSPWCSPCSLAAVVAIARRGLRARRVRSRAGRDAGRRSLRVAAPPARHLAVRLRHPRRVHGGLGREHLEHRLPAGRAPRRGGARPARLRRVPGRDPDHPPAHRPRLGPIRPRPRRGRRDGRPRSSAASSSRCCRSRPPRSSDSPWPASRSARSCRSRSPRPAALAPARSDEIIARVNLFNYAGAVLGAVLLGLLADAPAWGSRSSCRPRCWCPCCSSPPVPRARRRRWRGARRRRRGRRGRGIRRSLTCDSEPEERARRRTRTRSGRDAEPRARRRRSGSAGRRRRSRSASASTSPSRRATKLTKATMAWFPIRVWRHFLHQQRLPAGRGHQLSGAVRDLRRDLCRVRDHRPVARRQRRCRQRDDRAHQQLHPRADRRRTASSRPRRCSRSRRARAACSASPASSPSAR